MKYLFYLLPGLLNLVMGLFFFITAKRMADAGASSLAVTATTAIWALIYAGISLVIGRYTTRKNAVKIMIGSQVILLLAMLGLLFSPAVKMQYLWLLLSGLGTGLFFTPFQTVVKMFEKVEIAPETFARSAAVYTFSWSLGQGCGPLVAALLWGAFDPVNGWKYCYIINIIVVLLVIAVLLVMLNFIRKKLSVANKDNSSDGTENSVIRPVDGHVDIMHAVWFIAFGGFLAVAMLRAYLPDYATKILAWPTAAQGLMLALINIAQALAALSCCRARRWPFRPWGMMIASVLPVITMLLLANTNCSAAGYIASVLFGCFSGVLAFSMTYHALANADKSARYAAGNESIVGTTAVVGPICAGYLADVFTPQVPFYLLIVVIVICSAIFVGKTWQYRR